MVLLKKSGMKQGGQGSELLQRRKQRDLPQDLWKTHGIGLTIAMDEETLSPCFRHDQGLQVMNGHQQLRWREVLAVAGMGKSKAGKRTWSVACETSLASTKGNQTSI
jgi:hypothetical protein